MSVTIVTNFLIFRAHFDLSMATSTY